MRYVQVKFVWFIFAQIASVFCLKTLLSYLFLFIYLFIYFFGGGEGNCPLLPPSSYAYGEGKLLKGKKSLRIFRWLCFHAIPPVKLKIILASSILPMLTIKDGRRVSKHTESCKKLVIVSTYQLLWHLFKKQYFWHEADLVVLTEFTCIRNNSTNNNGNYYNNNYQ